MSSAIGTAAGQLRGPVPAAAGGLYGPERQHGGGPIHCQDCSISQLCIPFTLNEHELDQLDNIIERKKPIQKGQTQMCIRDSRLYSAM